MNALQYTIDGPTCVIAHLATQPPNVLHQVVLRPDKIATGTKLIRLGETPGDEALCWIALEHIEIAHVLGYAIRGHDTAGNETWTVRKSIEEAA